jgi:transcriptional regulator with XRE-family HTH domain
MQPEEDNPPERARRYLTRLERQQVAAQLLEETTFATGEPILAHGAVRRCAKKFNVTGPAISNLWKLIKKNLEQGKLTASPVKKGQPPSFLYCRDELSEQIRSLPHCKRQTLRDMAAELGVGKSTLHRILRSETNADGDCYLQPHTNSLLPLLTDEHKVARVFYALSKLDQERGCFSSFLQDVHVDEKWFELTPHRVRFYVTNEEKENNSLPARKVVHKSHISKVMFLAATARPRYDDSGTCIFDGKIGIWPIVTRTPAVRNSVNRPAGTIITKPQNVTNEIYRQMLLEKVIPAIKNRFPHNRNRSVSIQQDGAGAHISSTDEIFCRELNRIQGKCCLLSVHVSFFVTNGFSIVLQVFGTSNY